MLYRIDTRSAVLDVAPDARWVRYHQGTQEYLDAFGRVVFTRQGGRVAPCALGGPQPWPLDPQPEEGLAVPVITRHGVPCGDTLVTPEWLLWAVAHGGISARPWARPTISDDVVSAPSSGGGFIRRDVLRELVPQAESLRDRLVSSC